MKIAILGDVHGNLPALEAAWRFLSGEGFDLALNLGDMVHYGPFPNEVIGFFRDHSIASVQGNCDRAVGRKRRSTGDSFINNHWNNLSKESLLWTIETVFPDHRKYLSKLPDELRFTAERKGILVTHGLPGQISGELVEDAPVEVNNQHLNKSSSDILVVGHTHRPALVRCNRGWIMNPGSIGGGTLPGAATVGMIEISSNGKASFWWQKLQYDIDRFKKEYFNSGLPGIFLKCVLLGRDPRGYWHEKDFRWRQQWAEP